MIQLEFLLYKSENTATGHFLNLGESQQQKQLDTMGTSYVQIIGISLLCALVLCNTMLRYPLSSYQQNECETLLLNSNDYPTTTAEESSSQEEGIWANMKNEQQQKLALDSVMPFLINHAARINKTKGWTTQGPCEQVTFGKGWGSHKLCNITSSKSEKCNFLSFGIAHDYSFDVDLASTWNCRGFAADPTIVHPSQLHPLVTFHNVAAKTLRPNQELKKKAAKDQQWWITSVPSLKKFLGIEHLRALKMDCEGCEMSLARDVLEEEPDFFHHVDQLSLEVHVSREWLNDTETLYYYGKLFQLLDQAGLKLQASLVASCNRFHEATGCMQTLKDIGYPCGNRRSCHDYLFAKV